MKAFLSVLLTASSFLTGILLVLLLTVFNPSFLQTQAERTNLASDWAEKITTSVTKQLPITLSSADQEKIQSALLPITNHVQSRMIECLYHPDQLEQEKNSIISTINHAFNESIQKLGLPQSNQLDTQINSYVTKSVDRYFESSEIKQVKEVSEKINQYKTPSMVCCILFGILSFGCWIALLALKSRGAGIALLLSSALLAAASIVLNLVSLPFSYDFIASYQKTLASSIFIPAGCALLLSVFSFLLVYLLRKKSRSS